MRRSIAMLLILAGGWTQAAQWDCWAGGSPHGPAGHAASAAGEHSHGPAGHVASAAGGHVHGGGSPAARIHGGPDTDRGRDGHTGRVHLPGEDAPDMSGCPLVAACNGAVASAPRVSARPTAQAEVVARTIHTSVRRPDAPTTAEPPPPRPRV